MSNYESVNLKTSYTLEKHLKNLCIENPEYIDLYATWELDKKTYENILMSVIYNYPHYSLHDHSHSKNIISNIEMVLGEDRIKQLGPTEIWMILQCAYIHDFGMVLQNGYIESEWSKEEFQNYLQKILETSNKDLRDAARYILELGDSLSHSGFEKNWPVKVRKYVTEIVADYFRNRHASLTKEYINNPNEWNLDLSHNGLIKDRLFKLAGEISFLHGQNFNDVMQLDYITNGIKSDYIHPRFIAEMIRLGDLLDLDNNRFNTTIGKVFGEFPSLSKIHEKKHASINHVLITPKSIQISANCTDETVYREVRNWLEWLSNEINDITIRWTDIVPECFTGYVPKITKLEILLNGKKDISEIIDLKFNISQEKAFEILEGANIYESKFAFLREFIQNAMDASKIQFWRDINSGVYDPWIKEDKVKNNLSPFDIDKRIFQNYKIYVEITEEEKSKIKIKIKDKGTGISKLDLINLSKVGESWEGKTHLKNELRDLASWLKPTGGFGIGLQSAFLVTDEINIETKAVNEGSKKVKFISRRDNGYISIIDNEEEIERGTEIIIEFNGDMKFSYSLGGYTYTKIREYDSFIKQDSPIIWVILDYIFKECRNSMFPIVIKTNGEEFFIESIIENYNYLFDDNTKDHTGYKYRISDDYKTIYMWDKSSSSVMSLSFFEKNPQYRHLGHTSIQFKGIDVSLNQRSFRRDLCSINLDILGMDTKETLTLNREKFRDSSEERIDDIITNFICFALNKYQEEIIENPGLLQEKDINSFHMRILYDLYNNCKTIDKNEVYYNILKENSDFIGIIIAKKNKEENTYEEQYISGKELLNDYPRVCYINMKRITSRLGIKNKEINIIDVLNMDKDLDIDYIIIDQEFVGILTYFPVNNLYHVNESISTNDIYIYSINNITDPIGIDMDDKTYTKFLKNLSNIKMKRTFIPALSRFKALAIDKIPFELRNRSFDIKLRLFKNYFTISPITNDDDNKIMEISSEELFIQSIVGRKDFENLVEYTFFNQIEKNKYTREDIVREYKQLISDYYHIFKSKEQTEN